MIRLDELVRLRIRDAQADFARGRDIQDVVAATAARNVDRDREARLEQAELVPSDLEPFELPSEHGTTVPVLRASLGDEKANLVRAIQRRPDELRAYGRRLRIPGLGDESDPRDVGHLGNGRCSEHEAHRGGLASGDARFDMAQHDRIPPPGTDLSRDGEPTWGKIGQGDALL